MKSLRNLVCTVLMTMAMAVAGDDSSDEEDTPGESRSRIFPEERGNAGRINSASHPLVTDDGAASVQGIEVAETRWPHCGRLGCFGCDLLQALLQDGQLDVTAGSNSVLRSATGIPVEGAAEPESLNSILRRIAQQNPENQMQVYGTSGLMVVHLVPVGPIPSSNGSLAEHRDPSADDVNK